MNVRGGNTHTNLSYQTVLCHINLLQVAIMDIKMNMEKHPSYIPGMDNHYLGSVLADGECLNKHSDIPIKYVQFSCIHFKMSCMKCGCLFYSPCFSNVDCCGNNSCAIIIS